MFFLHFFSYLLPFLFEFEALIVVLDTPFVATRLDFGSAWLFLLGWLRFFFGGFAGFFGGGEEGGLGASEGAIGITTKAEAKN